jgi:MYXO-CTERM domain-containing protein
MLLAAFAGQALTVAPYPIVAVVFAAVFAAAWLWQRRRPPVTA